MSILIKGMEMPKHCWQCGLKDSDDECMAMYAIDRQIKSVDEVWGEQRVPDWCPLIEIPPHGRLIDADALPHYTGYALSAGEVAKAVASAPTIIEAEREE